MELLLTYINELLVLGFLLLVGFVLYMELKPKVDKTPNKIDDKVLKGFGIIVVLIDWRVNWLLSPLFWELPKDKYELVTHRMSRYKYYDVEKVASGGKLIAWRWWWGNKLCAFMHKHDPGHCSDKYAEK